MNSFQNDLHQKALDLSRSFQKAEYDLIDILQKINEAKVYLALGYNSLYSYAHECLGLSEANSYAFTAVAKKANQVPELKTEIQLGNLTVSKAKRILPVLTAENKKEWIERAVNLPKAALEKEVMRVNPESAKKESLRPISNDRFSLKLGISEALVQKLKRAQVVLMNKKRKNLSLEETLEHMTEEFLKKNDPVEKARRSAALKKEHMGESRLKSKMGPGPKSSQSVSSIEGVKNLMTPSEGSFKFSHPASGGRMPIPANVKHAVHQRDQGQCQFESLSQTDELGRIGPGLNPAYGDVKKKCGGMAYIEIHHKRPVAKGGTNALENLITLCSRHHNYAHELQKPARHHT